MQSTIPDMFSAHPSDVQIVRLHNFQTSWNNMFENLRTHAIAYFGGTIIANPRRRRCAVSVHFQLIFVKELMFLEFVWFAKECVRKMENGIAIRFEHVGRSRLKFHISFTFWKMWLWLKVCCSIVGPNGGLRKSKYGLNTSLTLEITISGVCQLL